MGLALAIPVSMAAQGIAMGSGAPAFIERATLMHDVMNYSGAIDQLNQASRMTDLDEQAQFTLAMSHFERGEADTPDLLLAFIDEHPGSALAPLAQMRLGDFAFYDAAGDGSYDAALDAYLVVPEGALDADTDEDLRYRMAYCYLRQGDYDRATALYNRLTTSRRYAAATWFYKAYIDYAQHNYADAKTKFQSIDPDSQLGYQAQYYLTQMDYKDGKYQSTIKEGNRLLMEGRNDYFDAELNRMVGESYYHTGENRLARQFLQRYFDTTEEEPTLTAQYTMGVLDYQDGNYAAAVSHLAPATTATGALGQSAFLYLGQARLKQGDTRAAMLAFEQAANMKDDEQVRETAFYNYAVGLSQGERTTFDRSIDMFEQFLNDFPNSQYHDSVEGYLVDTYATSTDYARALQSINRISRPGKRVLAVKQRVLYNLGVQELAGGNNADAITHLKEAATMGTYDVEAERESLLWLAEAQYRTGDYVGAAANQKSYTRKAGTKQQNYALSQYNLGYSLFQQRQYVEARKAFEKAIAAGTLTPELTADAYNRIGDTQYYGREFAAAGKSYDLATTTDSGTASDYSAYRKAMMTGLAGNREAQIEQIDQLLKQYPKSQYCAQALLDKAVSQAAIGRADNALATFDAVAEQYPRSEHARKALLQKAIVLSNLGRTDASIDANKQLISAYPTSDEAKQAVEALKLDYAERGKLGSLETFLAGVPGAPRLDINEVETLTFDAAEKAAIATKPSTARMSEYLKQYPNGAYAAKAHYYIGRQHYIDGKNSSALSELTTALEGNTSASWAEDAMTMQAALLSKAGRHDEAITAYRTLTEMASSDDNRVAAQLGLMRAAEVAGKYNLVSETATALLTTGGLTAGEEQETRLQQALASKHLGKTAVAREQLTALAADTDTEQGARAAYELAQMHLDNGNAAAAEKAALNLINKGTPHAYWMARTFIVLADAYTAQGRRDDARSYLQSLKTNYPGDERDIKDAINERLASLNKTNKKSNKK